MFQPNFDLTSFVVGEDSFKDIEIGTKESSGFWYFKNTKKTLIKNFILKSGKLTKKSCKITLI
ncbi:hypothetical protein ACFL3C_01075, partial [Patescibacteria group bacterium]